ncbi:putative ABC bile acid transporter [Aspergillus stella-maris]|uniref:putative ABC bile acid transporter n=1 Tax=Aspergillus stella-maris TaxID=1810926 RepID=UPI003CCD013B
MIAVEGTVVAIGVLGFLATVVFSYSAIRVLWVRFVQRAEHGAIRLEDAADAPSSVARYADDDGEATGDSATKFERAGWWQGWVIAVLSVVGFGVSLAQAIVATCAGREETKHLVVTSWVQVVGWIIAATQPASILTENSCVKRYYLGIGSFWTSLLSILTIASQALILWSYGFEITINPAFTALLLTQVGLAGIRTLVSLVLPRRPNVYFEGQIVDQEFSVSAYNRFTYGWATELLRFTARNQGLSIDDLPKLPFAARADTVHAGLEEQRGRKLWVALGRRHARALITQGLLSLVVCVIGFGPQVALYKILQTLEDRSSLSSDGTEAWLWVGGLGILLALSSSIESWLWWLIYSDLWVPIYEGLSGLVFAKSMRSKDINSPNRAAHLEEDWNDGQHEDGDEEEQTRQSIINLAAVDAKRIADFVTFAYLIPSCIIRLVLAAGFLARLIGWLSLLAGIGGAILLAPFNSWFTKRYAVAQGEYMKATDKRTGAVSEVLQGIRQIKFGALEQQWQDRIKGKREAELKLLWRTSVYTTGMVSVWIMGPLLLSAISLTVYALTRGDLSPSIAFTALSIFGSLESSLASLPDLFSKAMEANVSAGRIDDFLASAEKDSNTADVEKVCFHDATISWPSEAEEGWNCDRFILRHLTLQFPPKGLSLVVGKTGSGKSLLLSSILGECDVLSGSVSVPRALPASQRFDHLALQADWILENTIAYVAQNPWMENASIKENILFGLPYDRKRYRKTLFASGLEKDMTVLPDGDLTDIGANGINLSGGQRWRISFARALYSRAGILIMDDIFSALDAETGRHVFEHALTGDLGQGRTRILVTHHVGLCLPKTDYCVLLENGFVTHAGTAQDLRATGELTDLMGKAELRREQQPTVNEVPKGKRFSAASDGRRSSVFSMHTIKKFIQEETRETGAISAKVYAAYLNKGNGLWWWILAFIAYAAFMGLLVGRSWWVSVWTSSSHTAATVTVDHDLMFYLTVYVAISAAACVVGSVRCLALALAFIQSSRQLFDDLLGTVLRAPLRWLDTVPLGRILNRFTSDIYLLDWRLGPDIGHLVYKVLELAGILVAGVTVSPILLALACALLVLCVRLCKDYLAGVREIKRLESNAKSPVLEKFGSSLTGLATIRAFDKVDTYINEMYKLINRHAQASWYLWLFNRWLGFWMALVGALFSTLTAALVVYMPGVSAALAGFAMSFALQYNYAVAMGLRFYANVEIDMNATERVLEYTNITTENQDGYKPPAGWPTRGRIQVEDLEVGYADDLPAVLNGISFEVENNQRVGVVGRTGAGKSSLTLALFRFLEARRGRVIIDGLDISQLKLEDLRSRLAIIPQDPVLFSGTIRSNLDPFNEHSDTELRNALERVHLLRFEDTSTLASGVQSPSTDIPIHSPSTDRTLDPLSASRTGTLSSCRSNTKPTGFFACLSSPITTGGLNLSHGQRQLLCLARAIISHPKIMILDEATSAVDMETDTLIQQSIREEFGREGSDSSLLVIAHRLSTIADFDKILVLDEGRVAEWGSPKELLEAKRVFASLVERSGERSVVESIIVGHEQ